MPSGKPKKKSKETGRWGTKTNPDRRRKTRKGTKYGKTKPGGWFPEKKDYYG